MQLTQAVVLGLVQGLGEFLPISSSAHLILVPWFFGWPDQGLAFDVALHLGTLLAVCTFFWRDWYELLRAALVKTRGEEARLFWCLVAACIPGALFGYLLEDKAEACFRRPELIALMLVLVGLVLYFADRKGRKKKGLAGVGLREALFIGFAQALAVVPGVSRSGATIAAGLLGGLDREGAARFSFLLSVPIIVGAGLVKLPELFSSPGGTGPAFFVGVGVSALTGFASIGFLLRYVQTKDYLPFVWYRLLLGAVVFARSFF